MKNENDQIQPAEINAVQPAPQTQSNEVPPQQIVTSPTGLQPQQPSAPTVVVSADFMPQIERPAATQPSAPKIPSKNDPMPVGMSASQMGLDYPTRTIHWGVYLKSAAILAAVVVVVVTGFVLLNNLFNGMSTHVVTNNGYTYSFSFYKGSSLVQLPNGYQAYKHDGNMVASVLPTNNDNPPTACYEIGGDWKQVLTAQDFGTAWPVCSPTGTKGSAFTMWFRYQNHSHIFTIVYNNQQPSTVYPTLQKIFSSVKVTQSQ